MSEISFTEIAQWKQCRQKWHWKYEMDLVPRSYSPHITLGSLCHAGIEAWLKGEPILYGVQNAATEFIHQGMFEEEVQAIDEMCDTAVKVVHRYTVDQLLFNRTQPIAVEEEFRVRIPKTRHFVKGRFDTILRDSQNDCLWLVEWKFPGRFRSEEDVQLSTQLAIYQWAAIRCGYPVVGILYNQILPILPAVPEVLKNGKTSRREIMSDWQTYRQTLVERGEDPAEYSEMEEKLRDKTFWKSYRIYRTPRQVERYVLELRDVAADLAAKKKRIYMCESHVTCGQCPYRLICLEVARGIDPAGMIESNYTTRTNNNHDNTDDVSDASLTTANF